MRPEQDYLRLPRGYQGRGRSDLRLYSNVGGGHCIILDVVRLPQLKLQIYRANNDAETVHLR